MKLPWVEAKREKASQPSSFKLEQRGMGESLWQRKGLKFMECERFTRSK